MSALAGLVAAGLAVGGAGKPLTAADMPIARAGWWEQVTTEDGTTNTSHHCEDGKPIASLEFGNGCGPSRMSRTPTGGWLVEARCVTPTAKGGIRIEAEGDFQSAFMSDLKVEMTPTGGRPKVTHQHSTYTYIGPSCPADEAPSP